MRVIGTAVSAVARHLRWRLVDDDGVKDDDRGESECSDHRCAAEPESTKASLLQTTDDVRVETTAAALVRDEELVRLYVEPLFCRPSSPSTTSSCSCAHAAPSSFQIARLGGEKKTNKRERDRHDVDAGGKTAKKRKTSTKRVHWEHQDNFSVRHFDRGLYELVEMQANYRTIHYAATKIRSADSNGRKHNIDNPVLDARVDRLYDRRDRFVEELRS